MKGQAEGSEAVPMAETGQFGDGLYSRDRVGRGFTSGCHQFGKELELMLPPREEL